MAMNKRKVFLIWIFSIILLAEICFHFFKTEPKFTEKQWQPNSLHDLEMHLSSASHILNSSLRYNVHLSEKKSALAEIDFVDNFVNKKTGEGVLNDDGYATPSDDLGFINNAIVNLSSALNEVLLVDEKTLTSQEKRSLHDHIQAALDKMLQVQQAEQKSQPAKSNP
jgi:hypothetical protein